MKFLERVPILPETFETIVEAYNKTPPNFVSPSDDVINKVIEYVDRQIDIDD